MATKAAAATASASKKRAASKMMDEEIESSDSEIESNDEETDEIESEEEETVQEKKIRIAKSLIEKLEKQRQSERDDRDQQSDYVAQRLEEDLQTKTGKLRRDIAKNYVGGTSVRQLKGHKMSVTCVCITADVKHLFSGSKDGSIIKWNMATGLKMSTIKKRLSKQDKSSDGHTDQILCLAVSDDSRFLASGGRDKSIKIWMADTCAFVYSFEGHRDAVSGLVFRANSHSLYSCSFDRSVKIWNVDQLVYVETLFGHQDKVLGIDCVAKERCLTCGARDRSLRLWKIVEESQLVFNGVHLDSVDCVSMINEESFVSGSNDGTLALWSIMKKKPVFAVRHAHGIGSSSNGVDHSQNGHDTSSDQAPTGWVTAVAAYHNTDLVASGSDDGCVRLWAFSPSAHNLIEKFQVKLDGFVNDLKFSSDGRYLIAGVGREHKLGRWSTIKSARNAVHVIELSTSQQQQQQTSNTVDVVESTKNNTTTNTNNKKLLKSTNGKINK